MGSLTTLYGGSSSGGGGSDSHIVTDPRKLVRSGIERLQWKYSNQGGTAESRTAIPMGSSDHTAYLYVPSADTYATVLDITSSNGGYLHWVLSCGINTAGNSASVRITVDGGDAHEFAYQPGSIDNIGQRRMFIGGGLQTAVISTSTTASNNYNMWNSYATYGDNTQLNNGLDRNDDNTNNVYGIGIGSAWLQSDLAMLTTMPYQRLEFASTLKVEAKLSTFVTTNAANYATCFYSLF